MKKTFGELWELDQMVGRLYAKDETLRNTKFGYAYTKFYDANIKPLGKEFQEKLQDIRIDNALEDPTTKEIMLDKESSRGYKFSKEGLKNVIKAESVLQESINSTEVEIQPYYSSYIPELTDEEKELLKGLLIE